MRYVIISKEINTYWIGLSVILVKLVQSLAPLFLWYNLSCKETESFKLWSWWHFLHFLSFTINFVLVKGWIPKQDYYLIFQCSGGHLVVKNIYRYHKVLIFSKAAHTEMQSSTVANIWLLQLLIWSLQDRHDFPVNPFWETYFVFKYIKYLASFCGWSCTKPSSLCNFFLACLIKIT